MSRDAIAPLRIWRVAIVSAYWILIFTATHLPPSPIVRLAGPVPDWLMHGIIFAGLGWLLTWAVGRTPMNYSRAIRIYLVLVAYAALDEWTQPLVRRQCELSDWLADVAGAAGGMLLAICWQVRHAATRQPEQPI